uniref:Uncharacterized protein n=1 Tax=Apteryx owenii TaxID=8824 RepID=A0A8B9PB17_APTOW
MSAGSTLLRCLLGCLLFATWALSCPPQWLYYRGYCYGYFTDRKTWDEAEVSAERGACRRDAKRVPSPGASPGPGQPGPSCSGPSLWHRWPLWSNRFPVDGLSAGAGAEPCRAAAAP